MATRWRGGGRVTGAAAGEGRKEDRAGGAAAGTSDAGRPNHRRNIARPESARGDKGCSARPPAGRASDRGGLPNGVGAAPARRPGGVPADAACARQMYISTRRYVHVHRTIGTYVVHLRYMSTRQAVHGHHRAGTIVPPTAPWTGCPSYLATGTGARRPRTRQPRTTRWSKRYVTAVAVGTSRRNPAIGFS